MRAEGSGSYSNTKVKGSWAAPFVSWLFRRYYTHEAPGDCENVGRFLFALLAGLVRHHGI